MGLGIPQGVKIKINPQKRAYLDQTCFQKKDISLLVSHTVMKLVSISNKKKSEKNLTCLKYFFKTAVILLRKVF